VSSAYECDGDWCQPWVRPYDWDRRMNECGVRVHGFDDATFRWRASQFESGGQPVRWDGHVYELGERMYDPGRRMSGSARHAIECDRRVLGPGGWLLGSATRANESGEQCAEWRRCAYDRAGCVNEPSGRVVRSGARLDGSIERMYGSNVPVHEPGRHGNGSDGQTFESGRRVNESNGRRSDSARPSIESARRLGKSVHRFDAGFRRDGAEVERGSCRAMWTVGSSRRRPR
jgi:hypothetical protein